VVRRLVAVVLAGALLLGPGVSLVGVAVLMNPAAHAACVLTAPGAGVSVGDVPDHLDVTTRDGVALRLEHSQLVHAATIIDIGARTPGVGRDGIVVALMAALTESGLRMLSNTGAYPASANYPHDGDGGDHDSLGLFQMRPATGWGSGAELMNSGYQARAFYGGPTGPNHGSPRGLLDISGWRQLPKAAATQAVEVSAYPDRYAMFEPVAEAILEALTRTEPTLAKSVHQVPESGRIVLPLPVGTWTRTSGFGMRVHPITGERTLHTGVDLAAAVGTPILASADGKVTFAGAASGYGNLILIEHNVRGAIVVSGYAHMYADGLQVHPGDRVTAGQHIAEVGSAGNSTGPHLHFEIRAGASGTPVDPEPWLAGHGAASADSAAPTSGGCGGATKAPAGDPAPYPGGDPNQLVDDPTTDGRITARTSYILAQVRAASPGSSWSCWSPRPGTDSEHPLGRACDGTFGNSIGTRATGPALQQGWAVVNWLKAHAQQLGVEYLIWQGRIWSLAGAAEGWRKYDGGGMHDPASVTGGHFDHAHWTSES
jgi:murein DD-endopeptidase MepM/ murein hydrolase activator NlpD